MDMIGRIRRLHSRRNKSEREISRMTGLSRNTVSKWLHGEVDGPPKYRRGEQPNKLTVFHEALKQALKADARRPKHERRTAKALYAEIRAAGYDGGYTRGTDFIRAWRQGEGQGAVANAFIPLSFELGEAYQFDWSEEGLVVGGIYYRAQVAHMKLCASRAFWLVAYPGQGHGMSCRTDAPADATIVLVAAAIYLGTVTAHRVQQARRRLCSLEQAGLDQRGMASIHSNGRNPSAGSLPLSWRARSVEEMGALL